MRLGIATPSIGMMFTEADMHQKAMLLRAQTWLKKTYGEDSELVLLPSYRAYFPQARIHLLKEAIKCECDYTLWLDDDMIPPMDLVQRLFAHNLPIVGALASRKITPAEPVAFRNQIRGGVAAGLFPVDRSELQGLIEVDATGFANILIKTSVMSEVLQASGGIPFQFIVGYNAEDLHFWKIARHLGHRVYIDCDLLVDHLGTHRFPAK